MGQLLILIRLGDYGSACGIKGEKSHCPFFSQRQPCRISSEWAFGRGGRGSFSVWGQDMEGEGFLRQETWYIQERVSSRKYRGE